MAIDYSQKLDALRITLLTLPDAGPDGFEGLVATALADQTGLTFRLAKSGSQFGRDASTPSAPFAIAMEAKRYREKLRLEDLAGKATVAAFELGGDIDLWVLCATSELGDGVEAKLSKILEAGGITLLSLDWSLRPDPNLAVALASAPTAVLDWFEQSAPGVDRAALAEQLQAIRDRLGFAGQREGLRRSLCAAQTGLDALRRSSSEWLGARLADRDASQMSFGQFITVSEPEAPALRRDAVLAALGAAVAIDPAQRRLIAVLGEEGAGKTWLVAQWWAELPDSPIMIVVAGHRTKALDPTDAVGSLAVLLAEQDGRSDPDAIASWERRLRRWSGGGQVEYLRFVILFDGLNEATALPWAGIIQAFTVLLKDLGGLVIVTCRDGYWKRDVTPRLKITAGARLFRIGVEHRSEVSGEPGSVEGEDDLVGVVPRLVVEHDRGPFVFYALATEGYRGPGFNVGATGPGGQQPFRGVRSDEIVAGEVGVRFALLDGRLGGRTAAFLADWHDIQSDRFDERGLPFTANLGDGRNRGVEGELEWRFGSWTVDGHAVVNDPELTNPDPGFALGSDSRLPAVADFSVQAGLVHEARLAQATVRSELRLGYVGPTDIALSPTSTGASAGYLTSQIGVSAEVGRWGVRASVDNLFNRDDDTFSFGNPYYASDDVSTPQRPVTARVALTTRF